MVAFCVSLMYLVKAAAEQRFRSGPVAKLRGAAAGAGGASVDLSLSSHVRCAAASRRRALRTSRDETPAITQAAAAGDPLAQWLAGLPSLARLDVMQYRIIAVGLPLLSLGIITGAMWAKEAWGAYWQWDPKETAALVSWIVYAAYMHLHTRADWRGTSTAWVSVLGFADDRLLLPRREHLDQRAAQVQDVASAMEGRPQPTGQPICSQMKMAACAARHRARGPRELACPSACSSA